MSAATRLNIEQEEKLVVILKRIDRGDGTTDDELKLALDFYKELEWRLRLLGERYHHAWFVVYQKMVNLDEWMVGRTQNH